MTSTKHDKPLVEKVSSQQLKWPSSWHHHVPHRNGRTCEIRAMCRNWLKVGWMANNHHLEEEKYQECLILYCTIDYVFCWRAEEQLSGTWCGHCFNSSQCSRVRSRAREWAEAFQRTEDFCILLAGGPTCPSSPLYFPSTLCAQKSALNTSYLAVRARLQVTFVSALEDDQTLIRSCYTTHVRQMP